MRRVISIWHVCLRSMFSLVSCDKVVPAEFEPENGTFGLEVLINNGTTGLIDNIPDDDELSLSIFNVNNEIIATFQSLSSIPATIELPLEINLRVQVVSKRDPSILSTSPYYYGGKAISTHTKNETIIVEATIDSVSAVMVHFAPSRGEYDFIQHFKFTEPITQESLTFSSSGDSLGYFPSSDSLHIQLFSVQNEDTVIQEEFYEYGFARDSLYEYFMVFAVRDSVLTFQTDSRKRYYLFE